MTALIIFCVTIVVIIAIAGTLSTIEKCSFYKWKAHNPEAFKVNEEGGKPSEYDY